MIEESKFDYLTGIEKELVERGYKRFKPDYKKGELVEMKLKGDSSYYFSSMRILCFIYRKNDLEFIVGLRESDIPPMLCDCNRQVNFNGKYKFLGMCRSVPVHRMLDKIGNANFIELVENNKEIDFDMQEAEKLYYEETKLI